MTGHIVTMRIDDVDLLVETSRPTGSENTSAADRTQQVIDAFDRAQDAIVAVSTNVSKTIQRLAARGTRPSRMDVEFGLKFTAKGEVIVASGSAEVALKVLVGYDPAHAGSNWMKPPEDDEEETD